MALELDHPAFTAAVGDVRAGADTLHEARRHLAREVDGLLDAGWKGVAADAFAEGWADWQQAAGDALAGLVAMGQHLDAVHADLATRDADSGAALGRVAQRIRARLG